MISAQLGKVFMGLHRQPERGVTAQAAQQGAAPLLSQAE